MATADRDAAILGAEAQRQQAVQLARGQAEALEIMSKASAAALQTVGEALQQGGGRDAAAMRVAESYVAAIANVAKTGNTMLLPTASNDPAAATAAAMSIFNQASDHHVAYGGARSNLCFQVVKTGAEAHSSSSSK